MGNKRTDRIFHSCDVCNKEFSTKSSFVRHKAIHTGGKPFICDVCGKAFGDRQNLKNHQAVHFGKKEFGCNFCGTSFKHSSTLKNHLVLHTGEKPYSCDICGKAFAHRSSLSNHIALIHDKDKPFICKICSKQFSVERLLEAHVSMHEKKKFDCKICNKRLSKGSALKEHMLQHTGEKPHSCVHCNKTFAKKTTLKAHERIHTGEFIPCDICGKRLTTKRTMRQHMLMHQKKDYEWCYVCHQAFEYKKDLRIHMMAHSTQDTAQKGEKLGDVYVFPARSSLLKRNISQKQFPCTVCDKKFDHSVELKRHMVVHRVQKRDQLSTGVTEKDVSPNSQSMVESDTSLLKQNRLKKKQKKLFPCTVCDKTFHHPVDHKIHMMVHAVRERDNLSTRVAEKDVVPSSPPLIVKSDTSLLKQNMSLEKLFKCTVCNKNFDHPVDLKVHMTYYVHAVQERDS